eukprot:scaffold9441_cov167-Amphora_coffeaeformis.AAC.10
MKNYVVQPVSALLYLFLSTITVVDANTAAGLETLIGIRGRDFVLLGADTAVGPGVIWTATAVDKIAVLGPNSLVAAVAGNAADSDRLVGWLQAQATLYEYEQGLGTDVEYINMMSGGGNSEEEPASLLSTTMGHTTTYTVTQMAQLARSQIAQQLRTRSPFQVCLLVAGFQPGPAPVDEVWTSRLQYQVAQASLAGEKQLEKSSNMNEDNEHDSSLQQHPRLFWLDELGTLQDVPYAAHGIGSMFMYSILDNGYKADLTRDEACVLMRKCFAQLRQRYAVQTPHPPCLKCIYKDGVQLLEP